MPSRAKWAGQSALRLWHTRCRPWKEIDEARRAWPLRRRLSADARKRCFFHLSFASLFGSLRTRARVRARTKYLDVVSHSAQKKSMGKPESSLSVRLAQVGDAVVQWWLRLQPRTYHT